MGKDILVAIKSQEENFRNIHYLFDGKFFDKQISEALLEWILAAGKEKSQIPINFFREAVKTHPTKALAWHGLFCAISAYGDPKDSKEATDAMIKAMELGSGYFTPSEDGDGVVVHSIGTEPDDYY